MKIRHWAPALAMSIALCSAAHAADLTPVVEEEVVEESAWTVDIAAYAFLPLSLSGDSTVAGITADIDANLSDILSALDFAASGRAEAWRDNANADGSGFGFVLDGYYVNLGGDAKIGRRGNGSVEVDVQQAIVDLMLGYRFARVDIGTSGQAMVFDVMAGGRINYLRQKIDINAGILARRSISLGGDRTWVSPVIGGRANWIINDKLNFALRGDVAGFGVSGERVSGSLNGILGYAVTDKIRLHGGYRVYGIDYKDGSGRDEFGMDVIQHGPIVGVSYRF